MQGAPKWAPQRRGNKCPRHDAILQWLNVNRRGRGLSTFRQRTVFIARMICPRTARSRLMSSELIGPVSATSRPTRMQAIGESPETIGRTMKLAVRGKAAVKYGGRRGAIFGSRAF